MGLDRPDIWASTISIWSSFIMCFAMILGSVFFSAFPLPVYSMKLHVFSLGRQKMPKEIGSLHIEKFVRIWSLIWQLGMVGGVYSLRKGTD